MNGFSLILPTINAHKELSLCLESIELNSLLKNDLIVIVDKERNGKFNKDILDVLRERGIKPLLNDENMGPYASWNKGAQLAKRKTLCFITDDQYFAPAWDVGIIKYLNKRNIVSGQLVEPGVLLPSFSTIMKDFGESAKKFQKKRFLRFVKEKKKNQLIDGIFFIPLAIFKNNFFKLGMFSTKGEFGVNSVPNDALFIENAKRNGFLFKSSLESWSYHFQASSWEKQKNYRKWKNKLKPLFKSLTAKKYKK